MSEPSGSTPPPGPPRKTIMRSLGEFFGHIAQGVRTPVTGQPQDRADSAPPSVTTPPRQVTHHTVEETERDTPQGKVTLRRTIIEEVELPTPPASDLNSPPPADR